MTQRSRNYLVLACGTAVSLTFGMHAVSPALPLVQETFAIDDFSIGLLTSAYVLPGVIFAVPLGIVSDLIGRRWVFAIAGIFYGLMGIAQSLSPSFEWLLVWRLLQGVAFAALMPLTVTIIGDAYAGASQVKAQARRQVSMASAALIVPVIGAQLALAAWFYPFVAQGITIIPGLLALLVLDPNRGTTISVRRGYASAALKSLRRPGYPSVLSLGFTRFLARFSILAFLPIHMTRNLESSLTAVGIVIGIATGLGFTSALATARLSTRVVPSRIVLSGLLAIGLALVLFAMPLTIPLVFLVAAVYALGDGFISVLQSAYAARGVPERVRAGLVAGNGMVRNAGKFAGPLLAGALASITSIGVALAGIGVIVVAAAALLPAGLARLDSALIDTTPVLETS